MTSADGIDVEATFATYRARVGRDAPHAVPLALRTWARLRPDRWPLEWQLPIWLGEAFGLDRAICSRLVTSNVLGLASVRLSDDLADRDVAERDVPAAADLARVLYDAAVEPYRDLFAADDTFWQRLDGWIAAWRSQPRDAELTTIARRGAPLKIPAYALCELGGRAKVFADLEPVLDHALTGLALYDDACDWREDLAGRRWNAFVAGRSEVRVLGDLLGGSVGPYFDRIDRELHAAAVGARRLGIPGLARCLVELQGNVEREGRRLESRYGVLGEAAVQLVFGSA